MDEERKIIEIVDEGESRYCLHANFDVLGRMYDHEAEEVVVVKPEREQESACTMIVTANGKVIDHIPVYDKPIKITSTLSEYSSVGIGFSFSKADGYIKNSDIEKFYFLKAQNPEGFIPAEPQQKDNIDLLIAKGVVTQVLEGTDLVFYGIHGQETSRVDLSGFITGEVAVTADKILEIVKDSESIVAMKDGDKVKLELDAELTSKISKSLVTPMVRPSATELVGVDDGNSQTMIEIGDGLKLENGVLSSTGSGGVVEEIDPTVPQHVKEITENDIKSWDNKAEKSEIPDVSNFITNTVDNLVNYYNKTETDNKLSAIPKFKIEPVNELPTENISSTTVYLLKVGTDSPELYEEYIYVNNAWELLGTAKVDLTGYVTTEILNNMLQSYALKGDLNNYYTKDETYSKAEVNDLVGGADGDNLLKVSPVVIDGIDATAENPSPVSTKELVDESGVKYIPAIEVGKTYVVEYVVDGITYKTEDVAVDYSEIQDGVPQGYVTQLGIRLVDGELVTKLSFTSADGKDGAFMVQCNLYDNYAVISSQMKESGYNLPSITLISIREKGESKYYTKEETEAYVQEQIKDFTTQEQVDEKIKDFVTTDYVDSVVGDINTALENILGV